MQILKTTQYMENYGAHDWNGEGECPQYWKAKGGNDYVFQGIPSEDIDDHLHETLDAFLAHRDDYSEEYVVFTRVFDEDDDVGNYIEEWEREYLKYVDTALVWTGS